MNENKQAEPVAQPYAYVYEFDSGMFGIHRSFSSNERNGSKPSRVVPVYTHPAPAVMQEPVVQRTLGYEQGIQDAAKMLDAKANDYAKEFGFDDMGALEFSREAQRDYHSTLVELAEEVRSMEATNSAPAVSEEPVGEIQIEDMGKPFNAARVRVHFYKEVPPVGAKIYTEAPAVAVNEQDRLDAARYRWLFGARTEDECQNWKVGHLPLKPQDRVIGQVATVFMPKVAVDAEIDAAIASAEAAKGSV